MALAARMQSVVFLEDHQNAGYHRTTKDSAAASTRQEEHISTERVLSRTLDPQRMTNGTRLVRQESEGPREVSLEKYRAMLHLYVC